MSDELFSTIFFFIVIGAPFCGAQQCNPSDGYEYICKGIVHQFPETYYNAYQLRCDECQISHFDNETFPFGNEFRTFNVSNSGIKYVGARSFGHFLYLQYLYLHKNQIGNISKGAFEGLNHLNELHLENNLLDTIEPGTLRGVSATVVNISNNSLENLPAHAFHGTIKLLNLDLSRNQLNKLDNDTFEGLQSLETLDLSFNLLGHLPLEIFKPLSALHLLTLANNKLGTIEPGTLRGVSANVVNISDNTLEYLPSHAFNGMIKLDNLDLSRNRLNKLDIDTFEGLRSLETLDLSFNLLCNLPVGVFKSLSALKHLSLANNKFTGFSSGTFSGLTHINYLSLAHNSLIYFDPSVLLLMNYLTKLDVSTNNMRNFKANRYFSNVPTLKEIALEDNIFSCEMLAEALQFFQSKSIKVQNNLFRFDCLNLAGIACTSMLDLTADTLDLFLEQAIGEARSDKWSCSV